MAIRETIEMAWGEDNFTLMVTMNVIARVEQKLNLVRFVEDIANDDMKASHAAQLAAILLNEGGCKVDTDDCYTAMLGIEGTQKRNQVVEVVNVGLMAMFPMTEKKPIAESKPRQKVATRKKKAAPKRSTAS